VEVMGRDRHLQLGFLEASADAKDIRDTSDMTKIHLSSPPTAKLG